MISVTVIKPKLITTFAEGTHRYVKGLTTFNDKEVSVYIYFDNSEIDPRLKEITPTNILIFETESLILIESIGLELRDARLVELN